MRLSALGDVCLLVPLVRTLQKALPRARLTWVISRPMHALVEGFEGVEFIILDKSRPLRHWLEFYSRMRARRFDVLLATQASWRAHLLYPAIRAPRKIGFDHQRGRDCHAWFINQHIPPGRQHLLDSFLSFAAELGVTERVIEWHLPLGKAALGFAAEQLEMKSSGWLAVNPWASKPDRNWLPERYAAAINHAFDQWGWRTVLTGGPHPAERAFTESVLTHVRRREMVLNLVGRTTPKQLAAILGRVNVLLAPDTGPAHIATAMGTPVVGLYAVAPPELSAPYLSRDLVVNRFPEAVRQLLDKDPATVPWGTRVHSPQAMALIPVEPVLEKLAQARERSEKRAHLRAS